MQGIRSTISVSLRSKGLSSFATSNKTNRLRKHLVSIALECSDVLVAALLTYYNLSWSSWIALIITILATAIDLHTKDNPGVGNLFFPFFAFSVLPLVVQFYLTVTRRDAAQHALGRVKAQVVSLSLQAQAISLVAPPSFGGKPSADVDAANGAYDYADNIERSRLEAAAAAEDFRRLLSVMVDDLHKYLAHKRPYARHFYIPYHSSGVPDSEAMLIKVSRDIGVLQRRLHYSLRELVIGGGALRETLALTVLGPQASNGGDGGLAGVMSTCTLIGQQVLALQESIEHVSMYKELRTPVLIRAVLRWSLTIIFPVYLAYFWNSFEVVLSKAVLGTLAVFSQTAVMVISDVAGSLEDPFDDIALDAISLFESIGHISAMASDNVEPKPDLKDGPGVPGKDAPQGSGGSFNVTNNREFGQDPPMADAGQPGGLASNSMGHPFAERYKPTSASPHVVVAPPMPMPPSSHNALAGPL